MKESTANFPTQPPLAVVGMSALFPKAANIDEFWSNIRRGVDSITEVPATHWNPDDYFDPNQKTPDMTYARRGGFLSPVPFDPLEFGISPNNLEAIDTSQLLGMVGAKRALEHAGYGSNRTFDRSRVGCILGVTGTLEMVIPLGARLGHPRWRKALKDAGVPDEVAEDVVQRISQSYVPWQENSFPGLLGNVVAGRIANRLDLHGTNCVVDAACASSLSAIHLAALELWTGRSDMVVTGGIDTFNDIFMFMCFSKTPALSPSGDAKPFSDEADGTILGEGVGLVVLKRLSDAERDGDRIFAVLKGIGTSSDGAGNAVYAPKAEGQIRCLEDAYRVAGVSPATIELVEAHGTGTKVGDATEVSGLMHVYRASGRRGSWCAVGSVKSQIGHTKAAAGAAGVIKAILALQHRVLPPTVKVTQPPTAFLADDSPFYVNTEARPWLKPRGYPRRAAVSAFGFGGSNFHCVLEESPQNVTESEWDGDVQVIALASDSCHGLAEAVRTSIAPLVGADWQKVRTFAGSSRRQFRAELPHRLLFAIDREKSDLAKLATSALTMLERYSEKTTWSTPDGCYYGSGERAGKLGFLFPGQGSQYVGMLRELVCRFPSMSDALDEANAVFSADSPEIESTRQLTDFIYPHPCFSDAMREQRESELRATQIAQPAIGAVSLAVLALLDRFGIQPEAVAGHSYGELTALCASRRFSPQVLYRLSSLRGRLMAAAQETDGGMLAVLAPLSQIQSALNEMSVNLVVANHNSPTQVVLSGRIPDIERAASLFASRNIRGKKLPVAAAFHSPLVAPATHEFRPILDEVDFLPSAMPVYANSTANQYPTEPEAARDLLANQLAQPVHFVHEIERMYADGVRTFLEVGPGGVLTGLVNSILDGQDYRAAAIDSSNGKRGGLLDFANALANLAASGHAVCWDEWDPAWTDPDAVNSGPRLRIPICGANYFKPREPIPPRSPMTMTSTPVVEPETNPEAFSQSPRTQRNAVEQMIVEPNPALVPPQRTSEVAESNSSFTPIHAADGQTPRHIAVVGTSNADTLDVIRESLLALQRMQQETSRLHQRFLDEQAAALKTLERLTSQQTLQHRMPDPTSSHTESCPPQHQQDLRVSALPPSVAASTTRVPAEPVQVTKSAETLTLNSPAPAPVVVAKVPPAEPSAVSPLASTVLAVVSEKTGYPVEMLHLGMSLDHDLGIDSIKRVEILSALQERVENLPAFQPDELGALHSLKDVVALADARAATVTPAARSIAKTPLPAAHRAEVSVGPATSPAPTPARTSSYPVAQQSSRLGTIVLEVVSEKTGYPVEMLNLNMSLDHDLGIDSIKRVEILSALQERVTDLPAFQPEELGALHTLRDVVSLAEARSTTVATPAQNTSVTPTSMTSPSSFSSSTPLTPLNQDPTLPSIGQSAPAPSQHAPTQPAPGSSQLSATVLAVVSEKTGYPVEMLNVGMTLDHDLGIDSIKRVEILSALQERVPNLPAFQPEELGSLHTLRDVVTLANSRVPEQPSTSQNQLVTAPQVVASAPHPIATQHRHVPPAVKVPTIPTLPIKPHNQPVHDVTRSSPVTRSTVRSITIAPASSRPIVNLAPGSEIWITEDGLGLSLLVADELTGRGFKPRIVDLDEAQTSSIPADLAGLMIIAPQQDMNEQQLWNAVEWLQRCGPTLRRSGQKSSAIVATVSRLDGHFGFDGSRRLKDPVSGGLAGLAKCAQREWPEVSSRAFDLSYEWSAPHVAAAMLVTELLHEGPGEIGLTASGPQALEVIEDSISSSIQAPPIKPDEVIVVSGGARGVTAETVFAMAHAWRPRIVILGRSPAPTAEPAWLAPLTTEAEIKQALIARAPEGTTPKAISHQFQEITAGREVAAQLQRIRSTGASVHYHSVDVRDPIATRRVMMTVRRELGVVRGIIHGAGVLADQRIEDKTKEQFDRVYGTKVAGLKTLLDCVDPNELRLLGLFSSYTARYGRVGQLDYAIANEVLNKQARQFSVLHPNCRVASFNWGPWDGGMVQGGLKKIFAAEGVGLIPIEAGAETLIREFNQTTSRPVEVLVLANQQSDDSAQDVVKAASQPPERIADSQIRAELDAPVGYKLAFERELDIAHYPFLESHALGGKAVFPVAMLFEWLAHGAIHGNPGLELRGFDEFRVFQGIRLGRHDRLSLRVLSGRPVREAAYYKVPMQVFGHVNGRDVLHAGAKAVLSPGYPSCPAPMIHVPALRPYSQDVSTAYASRLFHGPHLQGISSIEGCSEEGIVVTTRTAPLASAWMSDPVRANWLADPLAIDAALQAVILWSQEHRGKPCLPCAVSKYRQYRRALPQDGVRITIGMQPATEQLIRCEIEFVDRQGLLVARMEGCESVVDAALTAAFQKNRIES